MAGKLHPVGNGRCQCRTADTHGPDQNIVEPQLQQRGSHSDDRHRLGFLVVIFIVHREGTQEIQIVAGHKNGDQIGAGPEFPTGKNVIHLRGQQNKAHAENGEQLQKISRLTAHGLPALLLHIVKIEGHPAVVQGSEDGKHDAAKIIGKAVLSYHVRIHHPLQHHPVALPQKQVRQAVKHHRQSQGQGQGPVLPVVEGLALGKDIAANRNTQNAVGQGQGQDPAVVVDAVWHQQNQNHRQHHRGQGQTHGDIHILVRFEFVGELAVEKVETEAAKGVKQDQQHQHPGKLQHPGHLRQEGNHHRAAHEVKQQRQGHHRGLVSILLLLRVFHPGIDQGAVGLQGEGNGRHTHPDGIQGHHAIAGGPQQPGKQRGGKQGDAPQKHGAENIKEGYAILFFHGQLPGLPCPAEQRAGKPI